MNVQEVQFCLYCLLHVTKLILIRKGYRNITINKSTKESSQIKTVTISKLIESTKSTRINYSTGISIRSETVKNSSIIKKQTFIKLPINNRTAY